LYIPEPIQKQHDKAIAVLYFDNMSREEDEYFSDGLTEELISRLNRIQNLKVASRTDVRIYKLNPASIAQIGNDLSVDYVVEGSVRKASKRIRITAQLINSNDGSNLWSETYERELTDIFEVQDDVANNIAQRLDLEISNSDRSAIEKRSTENLQAYDLVLRAKSKLTSLSSITAKSTLKDMHSMLERAVMLDPIYAEARSVLSGLYLIQLAWQHQEMNAQENNDVANKALLAAEQTLSIDAENEIALAVMPVVLIMRATGQLANKAVFNPLLYRRIKIQINRLAELYPESAVANAAIGNYYYSLNESKLPISKEHTSQMMLAYYHKAIEASERILKTTPNDPIVLYMAFASYLGIENYYYYRGEFRESLYYITKRNEIHQRTGNSMELFSTQAIGWIFVQLGEYDKAIDHYERALEVVDELGDRTMAALGDSTGLNRIYTRRWIAGIHRMKGEYLMATTHYKKLLEIDLGDYNRAITLLSLGQTTFFMGKYEEASEHFESSIAIWKKLENKKRNLSTNSWLSLTQLRLGNLERANTIVKQTEAMMKNAEPHSFIISNWNLSQVYSGLGEEEKSQKFLELAHDAVIKKANDFVDSKARETFLNKIRTNREVVIAWEKLNQ